MTDKRHWQRETATRKFHAIIAEADKAGRPMSNTTAARQAASYVGASAGDVLKWVGRA